MRLVAIAVVLAGTALRGDACPLNKDGPSPCTKLLADKYMISRVYMRSVHARPPAFDQAKTTTFIAGVTWKPIKADLVRSPLTDNKGRTYYAIEYRTTEVTAPALKFVDPSTVTTTPTTRKGVQTVLVRQVEEVDSHTIIAIEGEQFALVECRRGKRVSACLILRDELDWEKRKRDIATNGLK